jgi:hypothetical protein
MVVSAALVGLFARKLASALDADGCAEEYPSAWPARGIATPFRGEKE